MSFTLFCPWNPLHYAPFVPSPVVSHCFVILSTYIDSVVTPGNLFVDSKVYLIVFSSMAIKGSTSLPLGVILTPNKYKEYIHLTQATKSASSLLLRPVMPLLNFHIHLVHGFSILEPLVTSLVIRIFFFPYYYITSNHDYFS